MSVKIYSRDDFIEQYCLNKNGAKGNGNFELLQKRSKSLNILNFLFPHSLSTTTDGEPTHQSKISNRRNKKFYSSSSSSGTEDKILNKKLKLRNNKSLDENEFINSVSFSLKLLSY